jgi:DNA-directed RNA polymerase subunit beta'
VWAILEEIIENKYVLLNRAPTLHRLGIQAFKPVLIEGSAIQVHPLVCTAFNADFDGDQMAVHVPLGEEAQIEAHEIMAADKNILKPGNGEPTVSAKLLDIILGCYWMTKEVKGEKGEGKYFSSPNSAITTFDFGAISIRAKIHVLGTGKARYAAFGDKPFETTVGRILFNSTLPTDYPFVNKEITKKTMSAILDDIINKYGIGNVPKVLDKIKAFGFKYATYSGVTWGLDDLNIPEEKPQVIAAAKAKSAEVLNFFNEGLLTDEERLRKNIEIWHGAKGELEKLMPKALDANGSVSDMWISGARGSLGNITAMAGMKGLIVNTAGEIIEFPVISSAKEGLTPIEYFITTHGARKGLTDTALNTAKAGYLTRRLFDVAQDIIITEDDCKTKESVVVKSDGEFGSGVSSISKNIRGRTLAADALDKKGNVLFKKGHLLKKDEAQKIENEGSGEVFVRSPLTCKTVHGVCAECYGSDLGRGELIGLGEAVGTVAAQAIGEPGTQLTMRTFHSGGAASVGGDITQGLPRVEEVFEKRKPKSPAVVNKVDGVVTGVKDMGKEKIITVLPEIEDKAKGKKAAEIEYEFSSRRIPLVKVGDKVKKGQLLTDGSADIDELFKFAGKEITMNYVITEVNKLYELQGEAVSRKHIEIIVKQMFSRMKVKDPGDTTVSEGDIIDELDYRLENEEAEAKGGKGMRAEPVVMGITEASLARRSFLSAASFQHTNRVLINNAVRGSVDRLVGLKENVIIGRLIPAGTGHKDSPKFKIVADIMKEIDGGTE